MDIGPMNAMKEIISLVFSKLKKFFVCGARDIFSIAEKRNLKSTRNCLKTKSRENFIFCPHAGTVLIEFAIWIPILVILLFYAYDLTKLYRVNAKLEFVNHQFINVVQNKEAGGKVTKKDIMNALALAYQIVFPGKTLYSGFRKAYSAYTMIYYVKGEAGGKASCKWVLHITPNTATSPNMITALAKSGASYSTVTWGTNVVPSTIYPTLTIFEGQEQIIVENMLYWNYGFSDASNFAPRTAKEAFGFYLLNPKVKGTQMFFNSVLIFTPKPGLFDETGPL